MSESQLVVKVVPSCCRAQCALLAARVRLSRADRKTLIVKNTLDFTAVYRVINEKFDAPASATDSPSMDTVSRHSAPALKRRAWPNGPVVGPSPPKSYPKEIPVGSETNLFHFLGQLWGEIHVLFAFDYSTLRTPPLHLQKPTSRTKHALSTTASVFKAEIEVAS